MECGSDDITSMEEEVEVLIVVQAGGKVRGGEEDCEPIARRGHV